MPRDGFTAARIHGPELGVADAERAATSYDAKLGEWLGPDDVLDVVVLGIGAVSLVHAQGSVVHGTIKRIDAASKTVAITTANGT